MGYAYSVQETPLYAKVRLGILRQVIKVNGGEFKSTEPSYGLAVGAKSGPFGAEVGYTRSKYTADSGVSANTTVLEIRGIFYFQSWIKSRQ